MCIDNEPSSNVSLFLTAFPKDLTPQLEDTIIKCVLKRFGDQILADGNTVRGAGLESPRCLRSMRQRLRLHNPLVSPLIFALSKSLASHSMRETSWKICSHLWP